MLFHNATFAEHLQNDRYKGSLYAFCIEEDKEHEVFALEISDTGLSQLDDTDDDEGILESYSYMTEQEAREDIAAATEIYKIDYEELK